MEKQEATQDAQAGRHTALPWYRYLSLVGIIYFCLFDKHTSLLYGRYPEPPEETLGLKWEPCGELNKHALECSTLEVPVNHFDAEDSANRTFSLALMRMRGHNGTQNILLNPGGPGGSGLGFLYRAGAEINTIVGENYHLLAFDPRGVNQSSPSGSCFASSEAREAADLTSPKDIYTQSGLFAARAENLARSCRDVTGDYGQYLNTPQTASDMNSILDAINQKDMYYWGFSYGTTLGQTYAQMYPARSKRVIIDGVSDQRNWYLDAPEEVALERDVVDTEKVFKGFSEECMRAGSACALAEDFSSAKDLRHNLTSALFALRDHPRAVYINASEWGELTFEGLVNEGVFLAMYKPALWKTLATILSGVLYGNDTEAYLKTMKPAQKYIFTNELGTFVARNDKASSTWSDRSDKDMVQAVKKLEEISPLAGASFSEGLFMQREWLYPRSHNFTPAEHVETAHPLLILSTTYDPICPLISAQDAEKTFAGSVLVEQKGYGHCSISMPSLCKAKIVRQFLTTGELPAQGTTCEPDGPYFKDPEETLEIAELVDEEDRNLLRALERMSQKFLF